MRTRTTTNTRDKGNLAEQIAGDHLQGRGYRIIERNFACKLGEIDIVAQHQGELVFVEVRSRRSASALNPVFSVDRQKQKKIIRAAKVYLEKRYREVPPARFDVAIVTMGEPPVVEIIQDAFNADYY
ncbi:MAG: YraN family protein [Desulfomonilaceae bacterium]